MTTRFASILTLAALLGLTAPALAAGPCPDAGGTQYVVDTPAKAATIAAGYANNACALIISTNVTPTLENFKLDAKSMDLSGATIINSIASGDVTLTTTDDLVGTGANLRARDKLTLICSAPNCHVTFLSSEIIASTDLALGGPGGILTIQSNGHLTLKATTYGGELVRISSLNASVTFICDSAAGGCKDPVANKPAIITAQCGDPIVYPCTPTFANPGELTEVCIQALGITCGGGSIEFDVLAKGDVHLENTVLQALGIAIIKSSDGRVLASGADISAIKMTIAGKGNGVGPVVDLKDAKILVSDVLRVTATGCPPLPGVCIDLTGATLEGAPVTVSANSGNGLVRACAGTYTEIGPGFPSINGIGQPPYTKNTLSTAAQCAPDAAGVFD